MDPKIKIHKMGKKGLLSSPESVTIIADAFIVLTIVNFFSEEVKRMAKCDFCGKGVEFGIQVSHSHRRSNRPWKPNVKRVKALVEGKPMHVYVCTRCLRSGKVTRAV